MKCPNCKVWSFVLSTRKGVIRRRECANGHRFTTIETLKTPDKLVKVDKPLTGVKND
jgi:transcriptional regulator NrdR family protein